MDTAPWVDQDLGGRVLFTFEGLGLCVGKHAVAVEGAILIPISGALVGVREAIVVLVDFAAAIGVVFARVGLSTSIGGRFTKADQAGGSFELEGVDAIFVAGLVSKVVVSCDKPITVLVDHFQESLVAGEFFGSAPDIAVEAVSIFVADAQSLDTLALVADGFVAAVRRFLAALARGLGCIKQHGIRPDSISCDQVSVGAVVVHLDLVGFPVAELVGELRADDRGIFVDAACDVDLALFARSAAVALGVFELIDHRAVSVFCVLVDRQGEDHADLFAKGTGGQSEFLKGESEQFIKGDGVFFGSIGTFGWKAIARGAIIGAASESSGVESAFFNRWKVVSVGGLVTCAQKDRLAGLFGKVEKFLDG